MLVQKVLQTITAYRMFHAGDRVVVAVSGGPDSVALFHILYTLRDQLEIDLVVGHVHHGLRGAEAEQEARFVLNLAERFKVPATLKRANVNDWQAVHGGSLEMAARAVRYQCLRQIMLEESASKIAVAHHADDQAEEVLLRLFRGAGPAGLAGMPPTSGQWLARPLIDCHRQEILAYLSLVDQEWCQDSSNLQPWCRRNILRLKWLPRLQREFNTNLNATLVKTANLAREENDFWDSLLNSWLEQHAVSEANGAVLLPINALAECHPAMQRRLLRTVLRQVAGKLQGIGLRHIEMLGQQIHAGRSRGSLHLPNQLMSERSYNWLRISLRSSEPPPELHLEIPSLGTYQVFQLHHTIHLQQVDRCESIEISRDPLEVMLDRDRLSFPLLLRSVQPGDRFRPLGMQGSKKLQDLFIDLKVPRYQRCRIPVLCSQEHIIWVVGLRIDERVKVTSATRRILLAKYAPAHPG
ncbi:MAG: tRNA lysidine(34) synthetase TilS [Deltaproteobacteria bacterium]|nr:tRNA lysidine(34) synthetase TilS [Deltaproteobacteria bacterium]MBW2071703.1 tRNA lysidine(34) synthetase TilS [Deltaproteobacteria bacterium]